MIQGKLGEKSGHLAGQENSTFFLKLQLSATGLMLVNLYTHGKKVKLTCQTCSKELNCLSGNA